jgi:elongator complex protein 2
MVSAATKYISAGGNRHPSAADWDLRSRILAFGADNNVALWKPEVCCGRRELLFGKFCILTFDLRI